MTKPQSIRTRILFWFVSALFLVLLLSSCSFYFYMRSFLYSNAEKQIRDKNFAVGGWIDYRLKDMNAQVEGYKSSQEANIFIQVTDLSRKVVGKTSNLKEKLPLTEALAKAVYKKDDVIITHYQSPRYGGMLVANGTGLTNGKILGFVQVAIPENEITSTLNRIIVWIILSIPILLLMSYFIGLFLTQRLIAPFALVTESAQQISANKLSSSRLKVVNPNDELGQLTQTVNRLLDRLDEAINSQQQFVADAAHELRTPLAIMQSEIEITLKGAPDISEYKQALCSNLEEVHRLTQISDHLIALTRLDADSDNFPKEKIDLSELAFAVTTRFSGILKERAIHCHTSIMPAVYVLGSRFYLERVLVNVLDNAIKYSPDKTEIAFELKQDLEQITLIVKDQGMGIPEAEIPLVFNRFYRVDKSRSSKIKGSGLGLSIVKSIVEAHHGRIEIDSKIAVGTEVRIFLPKNCI